MTNTDLSNIDPSQMSFEQIKRPTHRWVRHPRYPAVGWLRSLRNTWRIVSNE